jgi:hypothetical protein
MNSTKYTIQKILASLFMVSFFITASAEGTKQIMPDSTSRGNLEIYDMKRPFAAYYNTDPLNRLYIHISNASEKIYIGLRHITNSGNNSTTTFRIKDPSGSVVYGDQTIPTSAGTGYISYYSQAVAGPKIGGVPSNGYDPFSYQPTTSGDYYLEFKTDTTKGTYYIDYFDLTVTTSGGTPILGRLWSYCWDLSTRDFSTGYKAKMYVLTDDGFVSEVNFNGIRPYGFTVACNSTGPGNDPAGNNENRRSLAGNHTRPQFKIFLNDPDNTAYPSGLIPTAVENLHLVGTPIYGQPIKFALNMTQPGVVQIVLDINGTSGYQANSADVILVETVSSGPDTIVWNGKDGNGNFVTGNTTVLISSSFATGTTHLPLYDPENHPNGYIVNRIRPATGQCDLFWDDSKIASGTVNIDGSLTTGHTWSSDFGDVRTMNTWWNGYQLNNLNSFNFNMGFLPVELIDFTAKTDNDLVLLSWATASETNNNYFTLEKSNDDVQFVEFANIAGAGNSNSINKYTYFDDSPYNVNYYRLKQTDFDGKYSYSDIVSVSYAKNSTSYTVSPNPAKQGTNLQISAFDNSDTPKIISLFSITGEKILETTSNGSLNIPLDMQLAKGVYFVIISGGEMNCIQKLIIN